MIQAPLPVNYAAPAAPIQQPAPEYNAIKIDIVKPQVQTAQDPVYSMPFNSIYSYPPAEQKVPETQV